SLNALRDNFPEVLGLFADVLRQPAFDAEQIEVSKTQIRGAIARQNDNPSGIAGREFAELVYGDDSPYVRQATYETVEAIGRDDLVAWHQRFFHPNNIMLGIVGDIDVATARELVEAELGDWARGEVAAVDIPPVEDVLTPGQYFIERNDMTQAEIRIGHLGVRRDHPDFLALQVLNQLFSGGFGSRVVDEIRTNRGLAYAVGGGVGDRWDHRGLTNLVMTTKVESTGEGIDGLIGEVRALRGDRPPTDEEIEQAKRVILNSWVFTNDSRGEILRQKMSFAYYDYPADWLEWYRAGLEAVTTEQVRAAAVTHYQPDQFVVLVVGPAEGRAQLEARGPVTDVDISIPEPPGEELMAATDEGTARAAELLAQAAEAHGGAVAIEAVQSMARTSKATLNTPQGPMELAVKGVMALPDKMSQTMTLPFGTMQQLYDGGKAFVVSPQGAQQLPPAQAAELQLGIDRDLIVVLQQRNDDGVTMVAGEPVERAGIQVIPVQIQRAGDTVTIEIDPQTGQVKSLAYDGRHPITQAPARLTEVYDDYRESGGVVLPFASRLEADGETVIETVVEQIEINPEIDDSAFAPPSDS
ncbi:MAG: pitrilysin family protein, partial [Acidobacteriota bacterium]